MRESTRQVKTEQAKMEGLDQLFEPVQDQIQDYPAAGMAQIQDQGHAGPIMIPLSRAAEISGQARRYLLTLVHKGKLQGVKDDNGSWLVRLDQIQDRSSRRVHPVQDQIHGRAVVDVQALLRELQAATYRNGYLESQLATASEQVKLLPDLQAIAATASAQEARAKELQAELDRIKTTWWYRFWVWFTGR